MIQSTLLPSPPPTPRDSWPQPHSKVYQGPWQGFYHRYSNKMTISTSFSKQRLLLFVLPPVSSIFPVLLPWTDVRNRVTSNLVLSSVVHPLSHLTFGPYSYDSRTFGRKGKSLAAIQKEFLKYPKTTEDRSPRLPLCPRRSTIPSSLLFLLSVTLVLIRWPHDPSPEYKSS